MKIKKINDWYIDHVLIPTEGLKYFPKNYELKIINDSHEYYVSCLITDNLDFELFYDIPRGQIIEEELKN